MVVGRPILLALEDIDGGPSFLEKALRFLEKFGKWGSHIFIFILYQITVLVFIFELYVFLHFFG